MTADSETQEQGSLRIESTRTAPGSDLPSACFIRWDEAGWYASTEDVVQTAVDMIEAAVYANMMLALVRLGMPAGSVSAFMSDVASKRGRPFGLPSTILLTPAGSTKRDEAVVQLERGKQRAQLDGDTAMVTARQWLEVATGVDCDRVVVAALRAIGAPNGIEALIFSKMLEIRTAGQG